MATNEELNEDDLLAGGDVVDLDFDALDYEEDDILNNDNYTSNAVSNNNGDRNDAVESADASEIVKKIHSPIEEQHRSRSVSVASDLLALERDHNKDFGEESSINSYDQEDPAAKRSRRFGRFENEKEDIRAVLTFKGRRGDFHGGRGGEQQQQQQGQGRGFQRSNDGGGGGRRPFSRPYGRGNFNRPNMPVAQQPGLNNMPAGFRPPLFPPTSGIMDPMMLQQQQQLQAALIQGMFQRPNIMATQQSGLQAPRMLMPAPSIGMMRPLQPPGSSPPAPMMPPGPLDRTALLAATMAAATRPNPPVMPPQGSMQSVQPAAVPMTAEQQQLLEKQQVIVSQLMRQQQVAAAHRQEQLLRRQEDEFLANLQAKQFQDQQKQLAALVQRMEEDQQKKKQEQQKEAAAAAAQQAAPRKILVNPFFKPAATTAPAPAAPTSEAPATASASDTRRAKFGDNSDGLVVETKKPTTSDDATAATSTASNSHRRIVLGSAPAVSTTEASTAIIPSVLANLLKQVKSGGSSAPPSAVSENPVVSDSKDGYTADYVKAEREREVARQRIKLKREASKLNLTEEQSTQLDRLVISEGIELNEALEVVRTGKVAPPKPVVAAPAPQTGSQKVLQPASNGDDAAPKPVVPTLKSSVVLIEGMDSSIPMSQIIRWAETFGDIKDYLRKGDSVKVQFVSPESADNLTKKHERVFPILVAC